MLSPSGDVQVSSSLYDEAGALNMMLTYPKVNISW